MDGFLLVHGKNGGADNAICPIQFLNEKLTGHGIISYKTYPWATSRCYAEPIEVALEEIHAGVQDLKEQGATKIHAIGFSIGGNAVLNYATRYNDLDTLILLGPAHNVHSPGLKRLCSWSLEESFKSLEKGLDDPMPLVNFNTGRIMVEWIKPSVYISYFNPEGLCNIIRNSKKVLSPKHTLLLYGTKDITAVDVDQIFNNIPKLAGSHIQSFEGVDHIGIVSAGYETVVNWLKTVS